MLFLHPFLLLGLLGIAIPVAIHLLNRRHAQEEPWGAMRFLLDSLLSRRRSLLLEEMLLLATRCLLVGCAALAMARPFVPAGSAFPWWLALPLGLLGIMFFGMGFALTRFRVWQRLVWLASLLCVAVTAGSALLERRLGLNRFAGGAARDIALLIDGSSSMTLEVEGETNFNRARREAQRLVEEAPRGVAFSVLVAGAVPDPLVPAPVTDRKYVQDALERAMPTHGMLQVPDALAAAAASLAQGAQTAKQIVLFGDGQGVGWETGNLERWAFLRKAFEVLPSRPAILVRALDLPSGIRNVAVRDLAFARPVVGTDRDVRIDVTLWNTGREAVTPAQVSLLIEGQERLDRSTGQMAPGSEHLVSFRHRFETPGAQVVEARVSAGDELATDDSMRRVIQVIRSLRILVVDDGRGARLLDRPGGYAALALMPAARALQADRRDAAEETQPARFLMEPELATIGDMGLKRSLSEYAAIILADLADLPETQAARLADYARAGGSLLVTHGARSNAAFYNGWRSEDQPVLPLPLSERPAIGSMESGARPDPATFRHPALTLFRDSGDLDGAVIESYRETPDSARTEGIAARLRNGAPLLASHELGRGRVLQMLAPLDRTVGNLVTRHAFLPLIQEITAYLAQPVIASLNIPPARGAVVQLASATPTELGGSGLSAEYFRKGALRKSLLTRIDPTLNMDWGDGSPGPGVPRDNFVVRWTGSFVPRRSGAHTFHLRADDRLTLRIGAHEARVAEHGAQASLSGLFEAGVRYPLTATFEDDGGQANLWVEMEGPDFPRARLPGAWLLPVRGAEDSWADALDTQVQAPGNRTFYAKLRQGQDGLALRTDSPLMPGLHQVRVPAFAESWLHHLTAGAESFPFSVIENPEESLLDPLTADERMLVARQADLSWTQSFEDLQRALQGKTFGRELWRIPALLLFALLVLETVLTRWICIQRRTGETRESDLGEKG